MRRRLIGLAAALLLAPGLAHAAVTITVQGTVESGSTVTVNGVTATVTGTTFTAASVPLALGPNTITATATDAAGNAASTSITVHLGAKVNVQGTVDASVTTVTVSATSGAIAGGNSVTVTPTSGNFSALVPMTLGVNTITANAQDGAGNANATTSRVFLARPPVEHP